MRTRVNPVQVNPTRDNKNGMNLKVMMKFLSQQKIVDKPLITGNNPVKRKRRKRKSLSNLNYQKRLPCCLTKVTLRKQAVDTGLVG